MICLVMVVGGSSLITGSLVLGVVTPINSTIVNGTIVDTMEHPDNSPPVYVNPDFSVTVKYVNGYVVSPSNPSIMVKIIVKGVNGWNGYVSWRIVYGPSVNEITFSKESGGGDTPFEDSFTITLIPENIVPSSKKSGIPYTVFYKIVFTGAGKTKEITRWVDINPKSEGLSILPGSRVLRFSFDLKNLKCEYSLFKLYGLGFDNVGSGSYYVEIYDTLGRLLFEGNTCNSFTVVLPESAAYIVRVSDGSLVYEFIVK